MCIYVCAWREMMGLMNEKKNINTSHANNDVKDKANETNTPEPPEPNRKKIHTHTRWMPRRS